MFVMPKKEFTPNETGLIFRELRLRAGLSREEMVKLGGPSYAVIRHIEERHKKIGIDGEAFGKASAVLRARNISKEDILRLVHPAIRDYIRDLSGKSAEYEIF